MCIYSASIVIAIFLSMRLIGDIKEVSEVYTLRYRRETGALVIVGVKAAVSSAKMLLDTQVIYALILT